MFSENKTLNVLNHDQLGMFMTQCYNSKMTPEQKENILEQLTLISNLADDLILDHKKSIDLCKSNLN